MQGLLHSRFICGFFYFAWIKRYKGTFSAGKELSIYLPPLYKYAFLILKYIPLCGQALEKSSQDKIHRRWSSEIKQIDININIGVSVPTLKDCSGLGTSLPNSAIAQATHKLHMRKLLDTPIWLYFLKSVICKNTRQLHLMKYPCHQFQCINYPLDWLLI